MDKIAKYHWLPF